MNELFLIANSKFVIQLIAVFFNGSGAFAQFVANLRAATAIGEQLQQLGFEFR
jgi:hypothetical protein